MGIRDIIFRGKRVDTGEWVYGYLCDCFDFKGVYHPAVQEFECAPKYEVNPETVGQYTGLNDKNGNKIFEGDIIRYPRYDDSRIAAVTYSCEDTAYQLTGEMARINIGAWFNSFELEIIGNIHDNFELLEVK